ncbi:MAG: flagellar basal-body rod protein FlgF [Deltaproteobacteria bacterium]|nr:flagellar basal-body rod protein FlgF [Deltaproteobacteria bacterium]
MTIGLFSTLSGMKLKEAELEVVAHNLANVATNGFKENRVAFEAVLGSQGQSSDLPDPNATPFAVMGKVKHNLLDGPTLSTNNPLDVAIQGEGFFEVQTEQGTVYTRDGGFSLNSNGELVTLKGDRVMGANGALVIGPGSPITVSGNGSIWVGEEERGQFKVVKFADPEKLSPMGAASFRADEGAQPTAVTSPVIVQGRLEGSNVNVTLNLVRLIEIARQYQMYQKVMNEQERLSREASAMARIA